MPKYIEELLKDYSSTTSNFFYGMQFNQFANICKLENGRLCLLMDGAPGMQKASGTTVIYLGVIQTNSLTKETSCLVKEVIDNIGTTVTHRVNTTNIVFYVKNNELKSRGVVRTMLITPTGICSGSIDMYNDIAPYGAIQYKQRTLDRTDRPYAPKVIADYGWCVPLVEFIKRFDLPKGTLAIGYDPKSNTYFKGKLGEAISNAAYSYNYTIVEPDDDYTTTIKETVFKNPCIFIPIAILELNSFQTNASTSYNFKATDGKVIKRATKAIPARSYDTEDFYSEYVPKPKEKTKLKSVVV